MKRIPRIILMVIALCLLCIPVAALAETDYEEGDGWIYRDGELKVITNNGLINFLNHEFDVRGDTQHKHTADDVDHVIIGKDVTDIVIDYIIGDSNPSSTTIEEGNPCFIIDQGWVVNKQTKTLVGAANVKENKIKTVVENIPAYIENIGMCAFSDCHALKQVSIPSNVIRLGESCFNGCESLTSITLPSTTTSIGPGSFSDCTALSQINFSSNIEDIQRAAFLLVSIWKCQHCFIRRSKKSTATPFGVVTHFKSSSCPQHWKKSAKQHSCYVKIYKPLCFTRIISASKTRRSTSVKR